MTNEEITRKLGFGSRWMRARIGVRGRMIVPYDGTWSASLVVGFFASTGIGGSFFSDRSECLLGCATATNYPSTLSAYHTGSNAYTSWLGTTIVRRSNATLTQFNTTATALYFSAAESVRSMFIFDYLRTASGAHYFYAYAPSSAANALVDVSYSTFMDNMARVGSTPSGYTQLTTNSSIGAPWTSQIMDSVFVAWTGAVCKFEVQNIEVVRAY